MARAVYSRRVSVTPTWSLVGDFDESRRNLQRLGEVRHKECVQLERDFTVWLDRQDADALTRVFDATGGKLLLLATHLAGPGQQAQDLVQSAFLAAMARGESWQRTRPLWPWLAGILQNEVRMQRRRSRQRREVAIDSTNAADVVAAAAVAGDPGSLAGADPLRLRVDGQLLTVEVVDEQSNEAVGVQLSCEGYDPDSKTPSWSKHPSFPEVGQVCSNWMCYGAPDGKRVMLTPFGFTWRIGTSGDSVQPAFARHEAFAGVYRATCRLMVRVESSFGKLHIVAVDEQGEPIRFGAALKAVDRILEHNNRRMISPPEGVTWDLPAGKWNVRTLLGKEVIYLKTDEGYARGFQDDVVTIASGETTELKVVAKPAGLVAFHLHSKKLPKSSWAGLRIELDSRAIDVHAHAHDGDRYMVRSPKSSDLPVMFVTRQAVPPGKQRFLVHAEGYQVAVCDVDVAADKLNTARVELLPR